MSELWAYQGVRVEIAPTAAVRGLSPSVLASSDTIFAGTKLPLRVWFLAMFLLTQAKNGLSALELSRQLGISYNSTWLMKHKLMQVMKEREAAKPLAGLIQLDDAYWGGRRRGKRGRGARGKTPLVAAVATDEEGNPRRLRLSRVRGFRLREIARWSQLHLTPVAMCAPMG